MSGRTDRWSFNTLGPGDSIADESYKFSDADVRQIDRLLRYACETHRHTGEAGADLTPDVAPSVTLYPSGGAIPAGVRYYYRFTVIDADGNESAASPVAYADAPLALQEPGAPVLSYATGTGALEPGSYTYALSAYKDASTLETKALNSATITVMGTNPSNEITLTMPSLPPGADGFNIYRRPPGGLHFLWLDTTSDPAWIDDGSVDPDCDRSLPTGNRSGNTSMITIVYPGATPVIPEGWSWRIYRTDDASNWDNSLLVELASPDALVSYDDVGSSTQIGSPPEQSQVFSAPSKIQLTDGAEVQGELPPGRNVVPKIVSFVVPGTLAVGPGDFVWVCDFDQADIQHVRAYLGNGQAPAATDVIVDVNVLRNGDPWESIFADVADDQPHVPVGEQFGSPAVPVLQHLVAGDALAIDIDQAGGGATPTDANLVVNVYMLTVAGSADSSYVWS